MNKPKMTHFASELDYEIYYEKYNTLTAEDIIHFYGLDESDFETDEWNREVYCYTLGHLKDYTNLKYSRDRNYLYKLFTDFKKLLSEVGVTLSIDSYKIKP